MAVYHCAFNRAFIDHIIPAVCIIPAEPVDRQIKTVGATGTDNAPLVEKIWL